MFYREHPELKTWTEQAWLNYLEKGSKKKRFQCCLDPNGNILDIRAIQGHSVGHKVDLLLQDNVENPVQWIEYIYDVFPFLQFCCSIRPDCRRKRFKRRTANRIFLIRGSHERRERATREVPYRTTWKVYQTAVYWIKLNSAQDGGLMFWQTNSHAIIRNNSVPTVLKKL